MARILVVDDDLPMRRLLEIHLTEAGHTIIEACEAAEAIPILLRRGFDLVVTDVQMPHLDGLSLAAAIREDPKTSHIPIVVLTGYTGEAAIRRASDLKAHLVSKSAPMEEIVRQIAFALTRATGVPAPRVK